MLSVDGSGSQSCSQLTPLLDDGEMLYLRRVEIRVSSWRWRGDVNFEPLEKIPDSPAGGQLRWYLGRLISAGESASAVDRTRYAPELRKRIWGSSDAGDEAARWRGLSARLGQITGLDIQSARDFSIKALVATAKGHRWWLTFEVESNTPHLIAKTDWQREVDFKLEVRTASGADAAELAEIERRCPIVLGDSSVYFDRGDDYFAFTRLMEDATVGIAFVDDKPAAVSSAKHRVRIGGVNRLSGDIVTRSVTGE